MRAQCVRVRACVCAVHSARARASVKNAWKKAKGKGKRWCSGSKRKRKINNHTIEVVRKGGRQWGGVGAACLLLEGDKAVVPGSLGVRQMAYHVACLHKCMRICPGELGQMFREFNEGSCMSACLLQKAKPGMAWENEKQVCTGSRGHMENSNVSCL